MGNSKKWSICFLLLSFAALAAVGTLTALIDPYFHYHAPLEQLQYPITSERYQNNGILRHFSYDAVITGTSMTENFKASECSELFGVRTVKTSISGSTLKELGDQLRRGLAAHPDTAIVIWGIDVWNLFNGKDDMYPGVEVPAYLYDRRLLNDASYLLNKEIFLNSTVETLKYTLKGNATTDFDEFGRWQQWKEPGKARLLADYQRPEPAADSPLTREQAQTMEANLKQNVLSVIADNPDVTFYIFFTPYSALVMDSQVRTGTLEQNFEVCRLASALLLEHQNVRLFSFFDDYDTITNLDNYCDQVHYAEHINSLMLRRMANDEYRLTSENYVNHWKAVTEYYASYDYDSLLAEN